MNPAPPSRPNATSLRVARRRWAASGYAADAGVGDALQARWQRSLQYGLVPEGRPAGAPHASSAQLSRARDRRHELLAHARPVMAFLGDQIRDSESLVILADAHGMLLESLGDDGFADRAARVALRPGAQWCERWRGTNAIGTAIVESRDVVVLGAEHFLERNAFLSCAAAPIVDGRGQLLGVLDISGDRRAFHRHTLALVRSGARMIEHQLFDVHHAGGLRVRLHPQREGLGGVAEGLLAIDDDGRIAAANPAALELLGWHGRGAGGRSLEAALSVDVAQLLRTDGRDMAVRGPDGRMLWLRLQVGRGTTAHGSVAAPEVAAARDAPAPTPTPTSVVAWPRVPADLPAGAQAAAPPSADALAALDTGDTRMHAVIERARRVADKPIALLLHGESGVGKEVLAFAFHRSGPRRNRPFVAVNCAALPESLIEAELFGYRGGAFTGARRDGAPGRIREADGGTLFLDEIGDMPQALQARLLRVLQTREVVPLGGGAAVPVDFRLVCATHRRLRAEIEAGRFREDLYYRINGLTLTLPALREREDRAALAAAMLAALEPGRAMRLDAALAREFDGHRWPGNLRQLHNALQTACALAAPGETVLHRHHLPDDLVEELDEATRHAARASVPDAAAGGWPSDACISGERDFGIDSAAGPAQVGADTHDLRDLARRRVQQVLDETAGNRSEAARRLGISRNTLYRKLREG